MGRGKPVILTSVSFRTKGNATAFFKEMLNRYSPRDRVADDDGIHLAALLERHHECAEKTGCGISHFEVMMTEHGTQCFRIIRTDVTGTDFSYGQCISQRPPTRKQEVSQALRQVVRFDLYKARDNFFEQHSDNEGKVICAASNEKISRDEAHMDHRPPMTFEVIVTTFLESRGLSLNDVPLTTGQDNQVYPEVTDNVLAESFRQYHNKVALLDFVKDTINLAQSSQHRLKSTRVHL